ncbi:hypothetical protein DRE_02960 [Drechslerella stenobrocha 248]|uniref:Uncharacterized protein n=1 Tax=Drechslerella stenobrocha 248 TaxID=1043628 RepID=W7IF91_9PEZI|nr:hypothetical protein DRE_02960 [Drechslerella stenobrocha 248]
MENKDGVKPPPHSAKYPWNWSPADTVTYLYRRPALQPYFQPGSRLASTFIDNDITGDVLLSDHFKVDDLQLHLGITSLGLRVAVWKVIAYLRERYPRRPTIQLDDDELLLPPPSSQELILETRTLSLRAPYHAPIEQLSPTSSHSNATLRATVPPPLDLHSSPDLQGAQTSRASADGPGSGPGNVPTPLSHSGPSDDDWDTAHITTRSRLTFSGDEASDQMDQMDTVATIETLYTEEDADEDQPMAVSPILPGTPDHEIVMGGLSDMEGFEPILPACTPELTPEPQETSSPKGDLPTVIVRRYASRKRAPRPPNAHNLRYLNNTPITAGQIMLVGEDKKISDSFTIRGGRHSAGTRRGVNSILQAFFYKKVVQKATLNGALHTVYRHHSPRHIKRLTRNPVTDISEKKVLVGEDIKAYINDFPELDIIYQIYRRKSDRVILLDKDNVNDARYLDPYQRLSTDEHYNEMECRYTELHNRLVNEMQDPTLQASAKEPVFIPIHYGREESPGWDAITLQECNQERRDRATRKKGKTRQQSGQPLSHEEIVQVFNQCCVDIVAMWRKKTLPRLEKGKYKIWTKARKKGFLRDLIAQTKQRVSDMDRNLEAHLQEYKICEWLSPVDLQKKINGSSACVIENREEYSWRANVYAGKRPEKPLSVPRRITRASAAARATELGDGEDVGNCSSEVEDSDEFDEDMDDFVVADDVYDEGHEHLRPDNEAVMNQLDMRYEDGQLAGEITMDDAPDPQPAEERDGTPQARSGTRSPTRAEDRPSVGRTPGVQGAHPGNSYVWFSNDIPPPAAPATPTAATTPAPDEPSTEHQRLKTEPPSTPRATTYVIDLTLDDATPPAGDLPDEILGSTVEHPIVPDLPPKVSASWKTKLQHICRLHPDKVQEIRKLCHSKDAGGLLVDIISYHDHFGDKNTPPRVMLPRTFSKKTAPGGLFAGLYFEWSIPKYKIASSNRKSRAILARQLNFERFLRDVSPALAEIVVDGNSSKTAATTTPDGHHPQSRSDEPRNLDEPANLEAPEGKGKDKEVDEQGAKVPRPWPTPEGEPLGVTQSSRLGHPSSSMFSQKTAGTKRKRIRKDVEEDQNTINYRNEALHKLKLLQKRAQRQKENEDDVNAGRYLNTEDPIRFPDYELPLYSFQKDGIRFLWRNIIFGGIGSGALLAHTMGMGKTRQVITFLSIVASTAESDNPRLLNQIPTELRTMRALVVAPAGLLENWKDEIMKWGSSSLKSVYVATGEESRSSIKKWADEGTILLIGYEALRSLAKTNDVDGQMDLVLRTPTIVVADEAHRIKNPTSLVSQVFGQFKTKRRIAMTGSPLTNNLADYFHIMKWIAEEYVGPEDKFRQKYATPIKEGLYINSTQEEKKHSKLKQRLLIQNWEPKMHRVNVGTIEELKEALPGKTEFVITMPITPLQLEIYHIFTAKVRDRLRKGEIKGFLDFVNQLSTLLNHPHVFLEALTTRMENMRDPSNTRNGRRKAAPSTVPGQVALNDPDVEGSDENETGLGTGGQESTEPTGKGLGEVDCSIFEQVNAVIARQSIDINLEAHSYRIVALMQIVEACVKIKDKLLIFSQCLKTLDYIEDRLGSRQILYTRLDGNIAPSKRQAATKAFSEGDLYVCLATIKSAGVGLNIQTANRVVILEHQFSPQDEEQAVGRAYRLGQKKNVFVYRFRIGGTLDDMLHNNSLLKLSLAMRLVDKKTTQSYVERPTVAGWFNPPTEVVKKADVSKHSGKDKHVMDALLNEEWVRGLETLDTYEKHVDEAFTAQEKAEFDKLVEDEEKVPGDNGGDGLQKKKTNAKSKVPVTSQAPPIPRWPLPKTDILGRLVVEIDPEASSDGPRIFCYARGRPSRGDGTEQTAHQ